MSIINRPWAHIHVVLIFILWGFVSWSPAFGFHIGLELVWRLNSFHSRDRFLVPVLGIHKRCPELWGRGQVFGNCLLKSLLSSFLSFLISFSSRHFPKDKTNVWGMILILYVLGSQLFFLSFIYDLKIKEENKDMPKEEDKELR